MRNVTVPLIEVADVLSGFAFRSERFGDSGDLPIVRIRDVVRGQSPTFYSGDYSEKYVVNDGDLLIGMDGEFNRARWRGGRALLNQRVCRVSPSSGRLDESYLFHFLPAALKEIERQTPFVTVKHLSAKQIEQISLPLPSIEDQRRIAAVLDAADVLRVKRRNALAKTDALTHAVFTDMFGDPALNPHGWNQIPVVQVADGPDGIKCGPFGTQLAQGEYVEAGVPLWGIPQVNRGFAVETTEFLTPAKAAQLRSFSIRPGDIVMTRKGTVGNCAVYPDGKPDGIMHSDLLRLRLSTDADPIFMAAQLTHSRAVREQIRVMSGGAIMPGINVTKLKELVVLAPPIQSQRSFASRVRKVDLTRQAIATHLTKLDSLFASLQQRAFRGEL